ncbi:MAG: autotransporter outer membrane beta-barrel domain-containing protein [Alphaproteobacteria bacterium]|nr:autotransporter outer membrane beta-barrel domain-containing protein [Alphaproteobacteria bacterium]
MKYSKTTLMELSHKYGKILKKCALLNAAILLSVAVSTQAWATGHDVIDSDTSHPALQALSEALQTGDIDAAEKGAKSLAPTSSAQVLAISQGVVDMLSDVATDRTKVAGVSGGDGFKGGAMWVQGLYNHAKQGASKDTTGFKANTHGVAMGMDAKLSDAMTVGLGYAYTNTKADSFGRDTDVDGHNAFLYGQYQPSAWYANWLMSYGYGKYKEEKEPMDVKVKAKYDVNSYAARLTSGYEFDNGFALEGGLRYLLVDQESYSDGVQRIKSDKNDVWTGMAGVRYAKAFNGDKVTWTPHANLAMTYDFVSDGPDANVQVLGGGDYRIHGEKLHRFGVEGGAGLTMTVGAWDLSADYRGAYRKNFQSHMGMLKAKYNF